MSHAHLHNLPTQAIAVCSDVAELALFRRNVVGELGGLLLERAHFVAQGRLLLVQGLVFSVDGRDLLLHDSNLGLLRLPLCQQGLDLRTLWRRVYGAKTAL